MRKHQLWFATSVLLVLISAVAYAGPTVTIDQDGNYYGEEGGITAKSDCSIPLSAQVSGVPVGTTECTVKGPNGVWTTDTGTIVSTDNTANLTVNFPSEGDYTVVVTVTVTYTVSGGTCGGDVSGTGTAILNVHVGPATDVCTMADALSPNRVPYMYVHVGPAAATCTLAEALSPNRAPDVFWRAAGWFPWDVRSKYADGFYRL